LEIGGIAAIDIDNHTAFHLEAVQTPHKLKSDNLVEHYADTLIQRKDQLLSISKYVVADAYPAANAGQRMVVTTGHRR
jgi:hypothetical protein